MRIKSFIIFITIIIIVVSIISIISFSIIIIICICDFSHHHKYLIDVIENVQRHFTKRLAGLFNKSYMDRLKICELELLETRRIRTNFALMYKILNGYRIK